MLGFPGLKQTDCGHHGRAVGQCKALFRGEFYGHETGSFQSFGSGERFAVKFRLAFADQDTGTMGERCEVTAGSETSLFGNDWMNSAIETFEHQFERFEPDAGKAPCERIRPDQHYRPYGRRVKRLANTDGVADDNVSLE